MYCHFGGCWPEPTLPVFLCPVSLAPADISPFILHFRTRVPFSVPFPYAFALSYPSRPTSEIQLGV